MARLLTDDQREMYEDFIRSFPFCWACGIEPFGTSRMSQPIFGHEPADYWRHLESAHIIGGAGRVADRRAICRLCKLCHDLNHGASIYMRQDGFYLPKIRIDHMLWLKCRFDGPIDRQFLQPLAIQSLPPICPIPVWFQESYARRRGDYPKCK